MSHQQSPSANWSEEHCAVYAEAGEMLRHYSTTRIAVLSIGLPVCLGVLGWVLSPDQHGMIAAYLLVAEAIVFAYSLALSVFFSSKYEQFRQALVRLEAGETVFLYSKVAGTRTHDWLRFDGIDKSLIAAGIVLHAVYYIVYFSRSITG